MDSAYFVLTQLDSGHWVRTDESIAASSDTVGIGETSDCQLRFPACGPFAEEKYAVIRRHGEAEWVLIPVSRFVSTYVNGSRVELVHFLADGDVISFEGRDEELKFEIRRDGAFSAEAGTLRMKQSISRGMVSSPMGKFCRLRWVWAPQRCSAGTCTSPMVSCSVRYAKASPPYAGKLSFIEYDS